MKISTFILDEEEFAVELSRIHEILRVLPVTHVPGFEAFEGAINHRGAIIPIVNLRKKYGLPEKKTDDAARIVILEAQGISLGVIVDDVGKMYDVAVESMQGPTALFSNYDAMLGGITTIDGKPVLFVDPDAFI